MRVKFVPMVSVAQVIVNGRDVRRVNSANRQTVSMTHALVWIAKIINFAAKADVLIPVHS
jgi:hypothetical protein